MALAAWCLGTHRKYGIISRVDIVLILFYRIVYGTHLVV
jgi:hypothetical protein